MSLNNIYCNNAGGLAFRTDVTSDFGSNYNDFYSSGLALIYGYNTLEEWQTATSKDANSLNVEPRFISDSDLHVYHACKELSGTGAYLNLSNANATYYLHKDIDLEDRSSSAPDIGADEYTYISEENDFLTFSFAEQTGDAVINTENHTVSIEVEYGTSLLALVATFTISENATVAIGSDAQISGTTANDFSSPVTYTITAEDGSEQNWVVTVSVALNNENDILTFSFDEQTGNAVISTENHTVQIEVAYGADINALVADFTLSPEASAKVGPTVQESGVTSNDFSNDVIYTVIAQNGEEQNWTVSVTVALNSEKDILSYSMAEQNAAAIINPTEHTVTLQVVPGTSLTALIATFTLSGDATAYVNAIEQVSGTSVNDFTNSLVYRVEAQDGTEQNWIVTVTAEPYHGNDFLTFSFVEQTGAATIITTNHTVDIEVAEGTSLSALVASFTISDGAFIEIGETEQVSGVTSNDFSSAVTYKITAEDGNPQNWTVTVTVESSTGIFDVDNMDCMIFPNPACEYIHVSSNAIQNERVVIELIDITGKVKYSLAEYTQKELRVTIYLPDDLVPGLYFVSIKGKEQTITKRLIVK